MQATKLNPCAAESLLTSYQVGALLQVNPSSVNKWIADGRIPAFRTPGGHRRIRVADLVQFLVKHSMPVPKTLGKAPRRRVLVVESDPKLSATLCAQAQNLGEDIELTCVGNAVDAMLRIGGLQPHVVVLDAQMINLDGLDLCRRLRRTPPAANMSIFLAAAEPAADLVEQGLAAGATAVLRKPFALSALLAPQAQHARAIAS